MKCLNGKLGRFQPHQTDIFDDFHNFLLGPINYKLISLLSSLLWIKYNNCVTKFSLTPHYFPDRFNNKIVWRKKLKKKTRIFTLCMNVIKWFYMNYKRLKITIEKHIATKMIPLEYILIYQSWCDLYNISE